MISTCTKLRVLKEEIALLKGNLFFDQPCVKFLDGEDN